MLYWLYDPDTPFRVLKYITFRAMMGASTAFLLTLAAGPWVIERLRSFGAVAVRKMDGVEETLKFPLPKGLKIDAATGLEIEVRKAPETGA